MMEKDYPKGKPVKMSMPYATIYCERCDKSGSTAALWGRFTYRFADGNELSAKRVLGWCDECKRVCPVENLPSISEIEGEIDKRHTQVRDIRGKLLWFLLPNAWREKRAHEGRLKELTLWRRLLTQRKVGPRCFSCGSSNVISIPLPDLKLGDCRGIDLPLTVQHPDCGSTFHVRVGSTWIALARLPRIVVSPEGSLIEKTYELA